MMSFDEAFDLGLCDDCDLCPVTCEMKGTCEYDEE